jgi:antitoxin component of MazEF toxin-antitoxin module
MILELKESEDGDVYLELPQDILDRLGWSIGTELKWTIENGEVIVEKL